MSEKLDELIQSNIEIKESYKTLISIIKGFVGGCSVVMVIFITFMISASSDIATIKAVLATKDNIVKLRDDMSAKITATEAKLHDEMGVYISLTSYIEIEKQRGITVSELFYLFGERFVNVKDEELEKFRSTAIFKLGNNISAGTVRSKTN